MPFAARRDRPPSRPNRCECIERRCCWHVLEEAQLTLRHQEERLQVDPNTHEAFDKEVCIFDRVTLPSLAC